MKTRVLGSLAIFTLALFPACGGGGGSSGPSVSGRGFAPRTGPGDVENYFPNAVGNEWSSNYTVSAPGMEDVTGLLTTSISEPRPMMGVSATVFSEVDSRVPGVYENYFGVSPGGVTALGNNSSDDSITPRLVPYPCLLFPAELGTISTLHALRLPMGTDQFGNPLTLDAVQVIENVQYEPLETWAGSFPSTIKQVTSISGSVRDAALNITVPYSGSETRWFAPGAGIVRQANSVTIDTLSTSSDTALRGYKVDGVRHGVGQRVTVLDQLTPDDGYVPQPEGVPALASDGTNFLVAGRRVSGTFGQYLSRWVVQRVAADGSLLGGSVDLGPPSPIYDTYNERKAAIVFDGVEYIVVYEQDQPSPGPGYRISLVAVRVSTSGALIGTPAIVAASSDVLHTAVEPALAFDGTRCLLAFVRRNSSDLLRVCGVFLSPATGEADGPEFWISPEAGTQSAPALAFDGAQYFVAWNQAAWGSQPHGIVGARVSMSGVVLDPAGILVHGVSVDPTLACDGGNFLALWSDSRLQPSGLYSNVYANRISPAGQLLDGDASTGGFAVTNSVGRMEVDIALTHFDDSYLVVWLSSSSPGVYEGLYGRRISNAGTPLGAVEGTRLSSWGFQPHAQLAAGAGSALLAWKDEFSPAGVTHTIQAVSLHPRGP